jgi:hypothetical protein
MLIRGFGTYYRNMSKKHSPELVVCKKIRAKKSLKIESISKE